MRCKRENPDAAQRQDRAGGKILADKHTKPCGTGPRGAEVPSTTTVVSDRPEGLRSQ